MRPTLMSNRRISLGINVARLTTPIARTRCMRSRSEQSSQSPLSTLTVRVPHIQLLYPTHTHPYTHSRACRDIMDVGGLHDLVVCGGLAQSIQNRLPTSSPCRAIAVVVTRYDIVSGIARQIPKVVVAVAAGISMPCSPHAMGICICYHIIIYKYYLTAAAP